MEIRQMLLPEFESEIKKTRAMLERVPEGMPEYKPHEKSMLLGKLAAHLAQLPWFAVRILETPSLDFGKDKMTPLVMESRAQLIAAFDDLAAKARAAITGASDEVWLKPWKLSFNEQAIMEGSRYEVYRNLFLNHVVHHRAQLGVYYRLNDVPVPATYGPSADDRMGF